MPQGEGNAAGQAFRDTATSSRRPTREGSAERRSLYSG